MVGWDTPEPNAWEDDVRPIYLVGNRRRTKNPPDLSVGNVKLKVNKELGVNSNEGDSTGILSRFLISVTDLIEETKS